jgi:predicted TIM-barrel fold metal-dependent hydrolase
MNSIKSLSCAAAVLALSLSAVASSAQTSKSSATGYLFNDSHYHITNYVQEGDDIHKFLAIMGNKVGRSTLFGIPLQQQWSYRISEDRAPTYYLDSDARLYYYSFTDAYIAMQYRSLTKAEQARFDPMITGFNPTDMYAADHIKRVLATFPGVFEGIGEFTIHKEFVSSKVAGDVASLTDPALDRILDFCAEAGLVSIIHNDVDRPFPRKGDAPMFLAQFKALLSRHPNNVIIWAHTGLGRVIQPIEHHLLMIEDILEDPACSHVNFDLSWDEVAKYVVSSPEATQRAADLINRFPDRFLFGTDNVASSKPEQYFAIYEMYQPLWKLLSADARQKLLKGNYERIFDQARVKVRAWEKANLAKK